MLITVLAAIAAFTMTPIYRAQAILAPVETEQSNSGMLGALGALGSLTSAIGLGGEQPVTNKDEAITIMRSRAFTEKFVHDNDLLPILFEEDWNAATESWRITEPDEVPTLYWAFKLFDEELRTISIDSSTGLVTLAIEWKDPDLAAQWVDEHIKRVNDITRSRVVTDATKRLAFLNEEVAKTNLVGVRQAIFSIIEGQYNSIALATTQEEYVFRIVDPALPPVEPARPNKLLMIAGGIVAGGLLAIALALFRPRRPLNPA
jgi:uncharacterized protein involved in exopolysaccharide biosynthesis